MVLHYSQHPQLWGTSSSWHQERMDGGGTRHVMNKGLLCSRRWDHSNCAWMLPKGHILLFNSTTIYFLWVLSSSDLSSCCPNGFSWRACCAGRELTTIFALNGSSAGRGTEPGSAFSSQGDFQQKELLYTLCLSSNWMRNELLEAISQLKVFSEKFQLVEMPDSC